MDIHGSRAIIMGPNNYLAIPYMATPIGITVEGANIVTRNLMIFGQGAMKCHPYIRSEIERLINDDEEQFINNFKSHFKYNGSQRYTHAFVWFKWWFYCSLATLLSLNVTIAIFHI